MKGYFPPLNEYQVVVLEDDGWLGEDASNTIFNCWAEDESHAVEQAENAYPNCTIISVRITTTGV